MNIYLIVFCVLAGIIIISLLILVILHTIAWCRLVEQKYPREYRDKGDMK